MLYIAENIKSLRKQKDMTQEDVAEILGVSAQSVSKWERGDTYPDITLLPSIANLYETSVDTLIGMDKINDTQARNAVFWKGQKYLLAGDNKQATDIYLSALKIYPNDENIMMELALVLAHENDEVKLLQAISLCERILSANPTDNVRHTTRAALCYIYLKTGDKERAVNEASSLPHEEVCRQSVLLEIEKNPNADEINICLNRIPFRNNPEHDILVIDFGLDMVSMATQYNLLDKLSDLRNKLGKGKTGRYIIPQVRVRDNTELSSNQVRVRHYADFVLDECYDDAKAAVDEIITAIEKAVKG